MEFIEISGLGAMGLYLDIISAVFAVVVVVQGFKACIIISANGIIGNLKVVSIIAFFEVTVMV